MKKLLLPALAIILTGCTTYVGSDNPIAVSSVPVYPPQFDPRPLISALEQTYIEAGKLQNFVQYTGGLNNVNRAVMDYRYDNLLLRRAIQNPMYATVPYQPWHR